MFDVLDDLEAVLDKVAASEAPVDVVRMRELLDRGEALWVHGVGDTERSGVWIDDGFPSMASWLREQCRLDHNAAATTVKLARTLDAMPAVAEAFEEGSISRSHAQVVSHARGRGREGVIEELDDTLAEVARSLKPQELRRVVQRVTDALDGDGGAARDREQYALRRLHISDGLDGMGYGDLVLEPEGKEILRTAIHSAMAGAHDANDRRTYMQRQYDALIDVVRVGMAHLPDGPGRHNPAHLSAVYDARVLEETDPVLAALMRCEAAHGPISRATLERWACDCKVSRIIVDGDSEVLDVGRAQRDHTPAQWVALVARDGGCVEPGCDRAPGWCDVHHKDPWDDGGETNIDNLELRCRRHHRKAHGRSP